MYNDVHLVGETYWSCYLLSYYKNTFLLSSSGRYKLILRSRWFLWPDFQVDETASEWFQRSHFGATCSSSSASSSWMRWWSLTTGWPLSAADPDPLFPASTETLFTDFRLCFFLLLKDFLLLRLRRSFLLVFDWILSFVFFSVSASSSSLTSSSQRRRVFITSDAFNFGRKKESKLG